MDIHKDFISRDSLSKIYKTSWLDQGFTKEQTKQFLEEWNKIGIRPQDREFLTWFLNFKKLDLPWALPWALENEEEFKHLRDEYESFEFETCYCNQPTSQGWCQSCNAERFQADFNNWTSGNPNIDTFIQKCQLEATSNWNVLEWIPYERFTNIEHIAKGGFGKVEKAKWEEGSICYWNWYENWERSKKTVALKTLTNSQNLNSDFLPELMLYKMFKSEVSNMVPCYGVSRDNEGNYILVMKYMKDGNLREYLKKNYQKLDFEDDERYPKYPKLKFLQEISQGLKDIHRKNLIHRDFHSGNIIVDGSECRITDLGLCKPVNEKSKEGEMFGIVPYVAPEVLQGKEYTQASDIYSFGIIAYEILICLPPFANQAHNTKLALKIIRGERPQFPEKVKYPQELVDLIKRCWDSEPSNRPTAREISGIMSEWFYEYGYLKKDTTLYQQLQEAEAYNKTLPDEIKYPTYQDNNIWHSKPINTKQITQRLQEQFDSQLLDLTIPTQELTIQEDQELQAQIEINNYK